MNISLYRTFSIVLAVISILLVFVILIWGQRRMAFIGIIPLLFARMFAKKSKGK